MDDFGLGERLCILGERERDRDPLVREYRLGVSLSELDDDEEEEEEVDEERERRAWAGEADRLLLRDILLLRERLLLRSFTASVFTGSFSTFSAGSSLGTTFAASLGTSLDVSFGVTLSFLTDSLGRCVFAGLGDLLALLRLLEALLLREELDRDEPDELELLLLTLRLRLELLAEL